MKLNVELFLLHAAEGGSIRIKFSLKVITIFLLLAKQGSSFTAPRNTKRRPHYDSDPSDTKSLSHSDSDPKNTEGLPHADSDPINSKSLSHADGRKLTTCSDGFTFNACADCCGYKFASQDDLETARDAYQTDKNAAIITYGVINCWDVSDITDMSLLFKAKDTFDEPIGCWDVSKVTTMWGMFNAAVKFNQDIGKWNVGKVTTMYAMFSYAKAFNQVIGNWNVGEVTDMGNMFESSSAFNQDLCAWYNKLKSGTIVTYYYYSVEESMLRKSGCSDKSIPDFVSKTSFCQACTCSEGKFLSIVL
jgi:surface protein